MILYEEYIRRHALNCPVIRRPESRFYVLYRADKNRWNASWVIMSLTLRNEVNHPSYYNMQWSSPMYNGLLAGSGSIMTPIGEPIRIEWDDYDLEVIKASQRQDGLLPITDLQEAKLIVWEMFLYASDERISNMPFSIRSQIHRSIDVSESIETRLIAQNNAYKAIQENGSNLASRFDNLLSYGDPHTYGLWFAEIAKQMQQNVEYRQNFCAINAVA